jgi:hypothetical protein
LAFLAIAARESPNSTPYSSESRLPLPAICGWKCAMPPCTATSD